jgi:formylglycine-generating enzyme required for sulfatase activity
MQRAAQGLVTAAFVLHLILGSQTTPGDSGLLLAGEKAKNRSENRPGRGGPTGAGAPSPFVHKASQKGTVPDSSRKNEPATPGTVITNTISMKLAYIPPGVFTMGSPLSEQEQFKKDNTDDWSAQEIQHEVSITKGFYMGAYPVTQEEYEKVMGKNPSFFSAAGRGKDKVAGLDTRHFSVEWVSWDDATEFCKKLSQQEGKSYRLPTEAEWEYACRAGTKTPFYFGDTISTDQANYAGDRVFGKGKKGVNRERPMPVGSFPPNAFGLYDMHGSVWQWCQDWYDKDYYQNSPGRDPVNETAGKLKSRVLRGGSWHNSPSEARSAARFLAPAILCNWNYGFRVVAAISRAGEKTKSANVEPENSEPSGKVITNSIGMKLVYIPPGKFVMGSPKSEQEQAKKDSRVSDWAAQEVQHEVAITKGFYMGVYAVTQEEYEIVTGKNPSWFSATGGGKEDVAGLNTRRFPVETVSWNDATEFCRKLSQKDGKIYRLPTEAEWEYACRAGTKTAFSFGDTISTEQANYNGNAVFGNGRKGVYRVRPIPVGSFPANALGLYDMHGNVNQWCQDWYDYDYYRKSPRNDPVNETGSEMRVLRSGSWGSDPGICRSANRSGSTPDYRNRTIGLRVVMSLP